MKRRNAQVFDWYRSNVNSDIARFKRYLVRVERMMKSGAFWELAEATRRAIKEMLNRLYRRLGELQARLVMKLAVGLVAFGLIAAPLSADTVFTGITGDDNPLNSATVVGYGYSLHPAFVDADDDGDLDVVVGVTYSGDGPSSGDISFFQNQGPAEDPVFEHKTDAEENPFFDILGVDGLDVSWSDPEFVDIDDDGDLDLFSGGYYYYYDPDYGTGSSVLHYKNEPDGPEDPQPFEFQHEALGTDNPLSAVGYLGDRVSLAFADIDEDGDQDAFVIGNPDGIHLGFFENDGHSPPGFSLNETDNPFPDAIDATLGMDPTIAFVDIDNDGDMDAFIAEGVDQHSGQIRFFKNTGADVNPLIEQFGTDNPFDGLAVGAEPSPAFVDIDADGDFDAFVGHAYYLYLADGSIHEGRIQYFKNTTPVEVVAAAQEVTAGETAHVVAQSNKFIGAVYVVLDGEPNGTQADLNAAVTADKGAKGTVDQAFADIQILTQDLPAGTYYAYAVSGAGELSSPSANAITVSAPPPPVVTYDDASGSDSSAAWIESITVGDLTNESGNDAGYGDYTAQAIDLQRGAEITVTLVPGLPSTSRYYVRRLSQQRWKVWVDWNGDGDFDDTDEEVLSLGPSHRAVSATFTVPADAVAGNTRVRIVMKYHAGGSPGPTGVFDFGEVEDYTGAVTE